MMAVEFEESNTIDDLSKEQLSVMARSDHGFLIWYLEDRTILDAHRIRLLFDLGVIAAKQKLEELEQEEGR